MAFARACTLVFCYLLIAAALSLGAQTPEEDYKKDRAAAIALFRDHRDLEALPLLEILAKQNPDDAAVLAALGSALVVHSATLTDEKAGNQERIRARGILTRAKQLGSTDGVMLNLLDIIPPDGAIRHDTRHSLAEETEALAAAASASAESSSKEKSKDPDLALLQSLSQAKMIEPYVLLNGADQGIAMDYAAYRRTHRAQLEEYLDRFVVPALPEPVKP
jgi:hypothetical protein